MKKPRAKREVAIRSSCPESGIVTFNASHEAASEFSEYGDLTDTGKARYVLFIDRRFDAKEVIEYIRNYGADDGP